MITSIVGVIIALAGIKTYQIFQAIQKGKEFANPPPSLVTVTRAVTRDWNPTLISIGTLEAVDGVDLTPELSGVVKKILFTSGTEVKAGTPLVELDTDILAAQLKQAQAKLNLNELNYKRAKSLLESQATSESSLDESEANYQAAIAQVEQMQGLLAQKTIKSPFDGRIGIRYIHLGQFVNPGTKIASIESVDPIHVNFTVAEQHIRDIQVGQPIVVSVSAYPEMNFRGNIAVIDSKIDEDTKSINVQAVLPNRDDQHPLISGMFASVKIIQRPIPDQVVIPKIAVSYTLYGNSVYVVTPKEEGGYRAVRTFIQTGDEQNDEVVVTRGLSGNELIVKTGQVKLDEKSSVSFKEIESAS